MFNTSCCFFLIVEKIKILKLPPLLLLLLLLKLQVEILLVEKESGDANRNSEGHRERGNDADTSGRGINDGGSLREERVQLVSIEFLNKKMLEVFVLL